jgi:hypothetical protein
MKTIIAAIVMLFSSVSFAGTDPLELVGDRCGPGEVLFYSQNVNHTKEVLVCQWGEVVFYSYGKIGQEPELFIKTDSQYVKLVVEDSETLHSEYLVISNRYYQYQVGTQTDKMINSDMNLLTVIKKGKGVLAEILLSDKVTVNGITSFTK